MEHAFSLAVGKLWISEFCGSKTVQKVANMKLFEF